MKDIFVDNSVSINLTNPLTDHYKEFISWLFNHGALVINKKLEIEYIGGNQTLATIIDHLTRKGRINRMTNMRLNSFSFKKSQEKLLKSNYKDRIHLKSVFLSDRKIALSNDNAFIEDINTYNKIDGLQPRCANCPSKIIYQ